MIGSVRSSKPTKTLSAVHELPSINRPLSRNKVCIQALNRTMPWHSFTFHWNLPTFQTRLFPLQLCTNTIKKLDCIMPLIALDYNYGNSWSQSSFLPHICFEILCGWWSICVEFRVFLQMSQKLNGVVVEFFQTLYLFNATSFGLNTPINRRLNLISFQWILEMHQWNSIGIYWHNGQIVSKLQVYG